MLRYLLTYWNREERKTENLDEEASLKLETVSSFIICMIVLYIVGDRM